MPIVQRPLAAVIARGDGPVRRPRDLEGRTVGVTGLPSDEAVVDSEVERRRRRPGRGRRVTIGFNAVASLAAGKVDAATGFWNAEGVALRRQGVPIRVFKVDRIRRPALPRADPHHLAQDARRRPRPGRRGGRRDHAAATPSPIAHPAQALDDLLAADPALDRAEQQAQLQVLLPDLRPAPFDPAVLRAWAAWDLEHGLLRSSRSTSKQPPSSCVSGEQALGQLRQFARHPRARHDQVDPGRLGRRRVSTSTCE